MTFESCSTKILRSQRALSQRKRRTVTAIATARPCHGRSASLRSYHLWTRCDRRWQIGHQADASLGSACIVIRPSSVKIRLTINSEGTSASIASKIDDPSVSHLSPRFATRVQAPPAPKLRKSRAGSPGSGRARRRLWRALVAGHGLVSWYRVPRAAQLAECHQRGATAGAGRRDRAVAAKPPARLQLWRAAQPRCARSPPTRTPSRRQISAR